MPSPTTNDYLPQLQHAIQDTRELLLADGATADANGASALEALDVSHRTYLNADAALHDGSDALMVAAYLDRKLVDANLTAINGAKLGTNSHAKGGAATAAMATAAADIKSAAAAVEAMMTEVFKVAGITNNDEANEPANPAAQDARTAAEDAGVAIEQLRSGAIAANIEAARIKTAPALTSAQTVQKSVATLLAAADHAFAGAADALTATLKARADDLLDLSGKSVDFAVADADDGAIHQALATVDGVVNLSLKGEPAADSSGAFGIEISWELSEDLAKETVGLDFFAVPEDAASTFDFAAASLRAKSEYHVWHYPAPAPAAADGKKDDDKAKSEKSPAESPAALSKGRHSQIVTKFTAKDRPLADGVTYVIFALRTPKGEAHSTDLSFPSARIPWSSLLAFESDVPVVYELDHAAGTFIVAFRGAPSSNAIDHYELLFKPQVIYSDNPEAEQQLLHTLSAPNATAIAPKGFAVGKFKDLFAALKIEEKQNTEALTKIFQKFSGPSAKSKGAKKQEPATGEPGFIENADRPVYVVYFNPSATASGVQENKKTNPYCYIAGDYIDIYGDPLRSGEAYCALVRAISDTGRADPDRPPMTVVSQPANYPQGQPLQAQATMAEIASIKS